MKYSKNFNETYQFYFNSIGIFDFCGTLNPSFKAIPNGDRTAKECFYFIESRGKNIPCSEPELLNQLLLTKASVNFQIKEWVQGRADGTLPLVELSKRETLRKYPTNNKEIIAINNECKVLAWENNSPVYYSDIETQYNLPEWVINAVENQANKLNQNL